MVVLMSVMNRCSNYRRQGDYVCTYTINIARQQTHSRQHPPRKTRSCRHRRQLHPLRQKWSPRAPPTATRPHSDPHTQRLHPKNPAAPKRRHRHEQTAPRTQQTPWHPQKKSRPITPGHLTASAGEFPVPPPPQADTPTRCSSPATPAPAQQRHHPLSSRQAETAHYSGSPAQTGSEKNSEPSLP